MLAGVVADPVVEWALGAVRWLLSLFPDDSIDWPDATGLGDFLGQWSGPLDPILPVEETALVFGIIATLVMPVMLTYKVVTWVWAHIPFVS